MIKDVSSASRKVACLLLGLVGLGAVAQAQTFSADVVTTHSGSQPTRQVGRVYVSGGKVRIEAPGFAEGFFIVDRDRAAAWFVRPRQRIFMDAKQSSPLTQLLVPVDPNAPCGQWQVMEDIASPRLTGARVQDPRFVALSKAADGGDEWHCDRLGGEIVDGRETLKYLAISRQRQRSYRWIDWRREFPVRIETEDGTIVALENIVDSPQPESLFAIPPDYQKLDPAQLINQIQHSDVWVEPPR